MYKVENTRWSAILINFYHQSSFDDKKNPDLDIIMAYLTQSAGYAAVSKLDMDLELYRKLRDVPTENFGNEEILKAARLAIDEALME